MNALMIKIAPEIDWCYVTKIHKSNLCVGKDVSMALDASFFAEAQKKVNEYYMTGLCEYKPELKIETVH